jgi:hypothetical protein
LSPPDAVDVADYPAAYRLVGDEGRCLYRWQWFLPARQLPLRHQRFLPHHWWLGHYDVDHRVGHDDVLVALVDLHYPNERYRRYARWSC